MNPAIGVFMGDPAGIGPEITVKSLVHAGTTGACRPIVIGNLELLRELAKQWQIDVRLTRLGPGDGPGAGGVPVVDMPLGEEAVPLGVQSKAAGAYVTRCLRHAFDLAAHGTLRGIVMAPICKESLTMAGDGYHSEFDVYADLAGVAEVRSVVKSGSVFRATVTGHIAFREILERLTEPRIVETAVMLQSTIARFGIARPRLAVAALNPHAGEGGLFGDEEGRIIAPAIRHLRDDGLAVSGPIPADTVYVRAHKGEFDGIVYLYHDQGNIANKAAAFGQGVVIYTGLPLVVTSPGHGTAFDIVGRGVADEGNLIEAIRTAAVLVGEP